MHLYKCRVNCQIGHPMWLVRELTKCIDINVRETSRDEYWTPTRLRQVLEYLSTEVEILEEIDIQSNLGLRGAIDYMADRDIAKSIIKMFELNKNTMFDKNDFD